MNNKQKIIITVYTLTVFALWVYGLSQTNCSERDTWSCLGMALFVAPAIIAMIFGIPTFILFKIWSDKKN